MLAFLIFERGFNERAVGVVVQKALTQGCRKVLHNLTGPLLVLRVVGVSELGS